MKNVRRILSQLRSLLEPEGARRRERVERTPVVEPMEPRALLSGMEPGLATVLTPHRASGELVIGINEHPSFHVTYQAHQYGTSIVTGPRGVDVAATTLAGVVSAPTADVANDDSGDDTDDDSDDDTDDDSDDDTDDDSDDDSGDNGDEIDIENDGDDD